jgi:subtilase family serine protease
VDASSEIGTCDGQTTSGSGGTASGLGPPDYVKAYDIPASPSGAGRVVAIVAACGAPTVVSDLAQYRSHYALPALGECGGAAGYPPLPGGPACLGIVSERGDDALPAPDSGWAREIALDVEMVSAACPDCSILLVEADSPNAWDLGPAVNEAVSLGASAISNSYGGTENPSDPFGAAYSDGPYASYYEHDGVLIAVASGDYFYDNENQAGAAPTFPSSVPSVLSVGGTNLMAASLPGPGTLRGGYTEVVAGNTTSGCSTEFSRPAFQDAVDTGNCSMRADVDVAASAENIAMYQAGWQLGASGTSGASPFVAALLARLGLANQTNAFFYAHGSAFYDITSGNNDPNGRCTNVVMCNARKGWDGPTGWGSPNGAALLAASENDAGTIGTGAEADAGTDAGRTTNGGGGSACDCTVIVDHTSTCGTFAWLAAVAIAALASQRRRRLNSEG